MHRPRFGLLAAVFLFSLILAGCGTESGDSDDGGTVTPGTELTPFTDKVKACTPYLDESSPSAGVSLLEDWGGWDPQATNTVLGKLFDPGIGGDECIYNQIEILDSHIEMANIFADDWGASGTYTGNGISAVVDISVTTVTIPYLGADSPPMERLITMNDPAQGLTVHMAFSQTGNGQTIVSQYVQGTESGVYYAWFLGNKMGIWHASIKDRKVQVIWEGNTTDKTFKISECTNATGGNWEAMGGGSIATSLDEMAFMARNNATSSSEDEYYLVIPLGELEDGDEQAVLDAGAVPPDGTGVLAYITQGNDLCLGFLGDLPQEDNTAYPDVLEDLAWEQ
jgi:hypothetical protein